MTLPAHVSPTELIESAWGNNVVDTLAEQAVLAQGGGTLTKNRVFIQARESIVSTNAGGDGSIFFLTPFATAPIVVACSGDPPAASGAWFLVLYRGPTTTKFDFRAFRHDGATLASAAVNVQYIAIGTRTSA